MEYKEIDKFSSQYYINTPLYYLVNNKYVLYKKEGYQLPLEKIITDEVPEKLYIKDSDLEKSTEELFNKLTKNLQEELDKKDISLRNVSAIIEEIVESMFLDIKSDSISFAPTIIKKIIKNYLDKPNIFKEFSEYICSNNELVHHSIRVLFYTITYCYYNRMDLNHIRKIGLASLFHAIGKTKLESKLLENRQLTEEEFSVYKMYPKYSYDILKNSKNEEIKEIADIVLKHKENENGTGFPYGIKIDNESSEVIGIIDEFERLISLKEKKLSYFDALKIIKEDVNKGKYNKKLFEKIVLCLGTEIKS